MALTPIRSYIIDYLATLLGARRNLAQFDTEDIGEEGFTVVLPGESEGGSARYDVQTMAMSLAIVRSAILKGSKEPWHVTAEEAGAQLEVDVFTALLSLQEHFADDLSDVTARAMITGVTVDELTDGVNGYMVHVFATVEYVYPTGNPYVEIDNAD